MSQFGVVVKLLCGMFLMVTSTFNLLQGESFGILIAALGGGFLSVAYYEHTIDIERDIERSR